METCEVTGCQRPMFVKVHRLCRPHYRRLREYGDPTAGTRMRPLDFESRLAAFVDVGDCWVWNGALTQTGYGNVALPGRRTTKAHRWVWENLVGPIPDGLELDHLCLVTLCVNPDHLEPVTPEVNRQRRWTARTQWCKRGHDMRDPANLQITRRGTRQCRACQAYTQRQRRQTRTTVASA